MTAKEMVEYLKKEVEDAIDSDDLQKFEDASFRLAETEIKLPKTPMTAYEAAAHLYGDGKSPTLANKAAKVMDSDGWEFEGYDDDGDSTMRPPKEAK